MAGVDPLLIDVPMPIVTERLLIRPRQAGEGAATVAAIQETWDELHRWMRWAEDLQSFTVDGAEARTRRVMASFTLREDLELLGLERATGEPVIWTGFHSIDWEARQCEIGYWVRKRAQGRGLATEAGHALLRYGFAALGMRRIGLRHAGGNGASRRVAEKLGFAHEGVQRDAMLLPGWRFADGWCYGRLGAEGLADRAVRWGNAAEEASTAVL